MICPKCKKQIPEKSLKCGFCGTRIATVCKKCGTYNTIYNLKCVNCNNQLLKVCTSCKSVNLPDAQKCRKCGHIFKEQTNKTPEQKNSNQEKVSSSDLNINPNDIRLYSQQNAKELLKKAFVSPNKKVISINGEKGIGKSIVLKSAINEYEQQDVIWLVGECSPITQLSPCGLIQNVLLTFFNVPSFCVDSLQLKKDSQKFFQTEFPSLSNEEIFNLLNFLYPKETSYYENILINKEKTLVLLEKIFRTIIQSYKTVFIIENFDYIDGFSYEFIHRLAGSDLMNEQLKFLLTYSSKRPVQGYIYNDILLNDNYLDITLAALDKNQTEAFIDRFFEQEKCPVSVKNSLTTLSRGNPAVLEQYVGYILEVKNKTKALPSDLPSNLNSVLAKRLKFLKAENIETYRALIIAAIQGLSFSPVIINEVLQLEEGSFTENLKMLHELNFILPITQNVYMFKNTLIWKEIFDIVKNDEDFDSLNKNLFEILEDYTISSNSIQAVIAQNLHQDLAAFNSWTKNVKLAAFIGDTNLYIISQKQCLSLVEKLTDIDVSVIKNNIFERLGKLLSDINPEDAMEYLPGAIENAKSKSDLLKEMELTGYLSECCIKTGNYSGVIECIDAVLQKTDINYELEIAMLKARKLKPLFNLGNNGELINLADNEILPIFEKYLNAKPHKNISIQLLYKTWLETYLILANSLVFQGNNRAFDVITTLFELFEKNNFNDEMFICKTKLAFAFANTVKGDINTSEEILTEILQTYKTTAMDNEAISRWNLINILNNFICKKYNGIKEELFQVVTFANNTNDYFTKNILKTLLGKLLKDEEKTKQALEIYSQQITFFAKEKNAIGALLCWYLIAEAKLVTDGPDKALEVASKALEISKGPKINNYTFTVLYNKIIAEICIIKGDFESAKVHIEKGLMFAKKFELNILQGELYLLYGKYLQDLALVKKDSQGDCVSSAAKMYKKAQEIAQNIRYPILVANVEQAYAALKSFCILNQIVIHDI